MLTNDTKIAALCWQVEQAVGRPLKTPKDFDLLSERIYSRLGELLSCNTLRRIWGTMDDGTQPRPSTLDLLARRAEATGRDAQLHGAGTSPER